MVKLFFTVKLPKSKNSNSLLLFLVVSKTKSLNQTRIARITTNHSNFKFNYTNFFCLRQFVQLKRLYFRVNR